MSEVTEPSDKGLISLHEGIIKALGTGDPSTGDKPFDVGGTDDRTPRAGIPEGALTERDVGFRRRPWQ